MYLRYTELYQGKEDGKWGKFPKDAKIVTI